MSDSAYKIDKNIPPPKSSRTGGRRTPLSLALKAMEVNDSILCPDRKTASASYSYGRYHNKKFICCADGDGVRVWRTE